MIIQMPFVLRTAAPFAFAVIAVVGVASTVLHLEVTAQTDTPPAYEQLAWQGST